MTWDIICIVDTVDTMISPAISILDMPCDINRVVGLLPMISITWSETSLVILILWSVISHMISMVWSVISPRISILWSVISPVISIL